MGAPASPGRSTAGPDATPLLAADSSSDAPEDLSLGALLWRSKLWRILAVLLVYSVGFSTLLPVTPTIFTNFFAGRIGGAPADCEATPQLPACVDAHAEVVCWSSATSFISNSVVAFLFSPLVGDASDAHGRKPFLAAAFLLALLPSVVVLAHISVPNPGALLLLYYPASAISGVVSSIVICLSYTADVLPPKHRTAGFGLIIAAFSIGFVFGPALGAHLAPAVAAAVTVAATAACAVAVILAVPESLPPEVAARAKRAGAHRPRPVSALLSLGRSWALINSRSLFRRLAVTMALVGFVSGGVQEMLVQYLQLTLGFTTADQGTLFMVLGGCNLLIQIAALPFLVPALGEQRLLLLGLMISIVEQGLIASAKKKWQALAAIGIGSLGGVAFPAISAIKANCCGPEEQGLVQGALAGIRALSSGLGPLAFSALFAACTTTGGALSGQGPGLVFWAAAALSAAAAAVAATVSVPPRGVGSGRDAAAACSDACAAPAGVEEGAEGREVAIAVGGDGSQAAAAAAVAHVTNDVGPDAADSGGFGGRDQWSSGGGGGRRKPRRAAPAGAAALPGADGPQATTPLLAAGAGSDGDV